MYVETLQLFTNEFFTKHTNCCLHVLGSIAIGSAAYVYKGDNLHISSGTDGQILSLKIDSSTNQLLAKLTDVEKKVESLGNRVSRLEDLTAKHESRIDEISGVTFRHYAAIDLLVGKLKDMNISMAEKEIHEHYKRLVNDGTFHVSRKD